MHADTLDFEPTASVLIRRCVECHNGVNTSGGLDLTKRELAFAGGESGTAIMPGDVDQSFLLDRVTSGEMPPKKNDKPQPLPAEEAKR